MNLPENFDISEALRIIKQFEGLRLVAYQDTGGVWTIGYGTTAGVKYGDRITLEQAEKYLRDDCEKIYLPYLCRVVNPDLNSNQVCALLSFVYNIGGSQFDKSTMLKMLNAGSELEAVADQFNRWVYDNGKRLGGLVMRRARERQLFLA